MNTKPAERKTLLGMGAKTWLVVFLLLAFNITFFSGLLELKRSQIAWAYYSLNPLTWPTWVAYVLWAIVLWRVADLPFWPESAIGLKQIIKPLLILVLIVFICYVNGWHATAARRAFHSKFYSPYIIGPYSNYLVEGKLNWRMAILPTFAVVALFYLGSILRKIKKHGKEKTEK